MRTIGTGRTIRTLIGTALVAGALVAAPAAVAAKDGDIIRTGNCSGSTDWKLKAGKRDGGIELEFEVDSNRNGQQWRVRIYDQSALVYGATRTTVAPSGSFSVERKIANRAGTDTIVARARNLANGELCVGKLSI